MAAPSVSCDDRPWHVGSIHGSVTWKSPADMRVTWRASQKSPADMRVTSTPAERASARKGRGGRRSEQGRACVRAAHLHLGRAGAR
eukprot:4877115-Prymnesium_polylepis.1